MQCLLKTFSKQQVEEARKEAPQNSAPWSANGGDIEDNDNTEQGPGAEASPSLPLHNGKRRNEASDRHVQNSARTATPVNRPASDRTGLAFDVRSISSELEAMQAKRKELEYDLGVSRGTLYENEGQDSKAN